MTGSSLAEVLGLFEPMAGRALTKAGVYAKMRDHAKLITKIQSLANPKQGLVEVDPQTQIFFDWGHKHEANGILSYLSAYPTRVVHEVGFVLLDPSLQTLSEDIRQGINPADLPVIGSSPDGIIVETYQPSGVNFSPQSVPTGVYPGSKTPARTSHQQPPAHPSHRHWRQSHPTHRRVLEIKAKTPFRPDALPGVWRWLGASCKPYTKILPQYFAQAQLNMLVTDSQSCHLLCYTVKGGSALFDIPLHKQWCNLMLHWVAQLNVQYVRKGIEPPEDVFWEQDAYRDFVGLTREACQRLDSAGVGVPSLHGSMSSPWFLPPSEATVPNTPEVSASADQPSQQQLPEQLPQQFPPGWQQQQVPGPPPPWVAPLSHPATQLTPSRQQEEQQQQQQQFSLDGSSGPAAAASAAAQPAPLRLLAAAAIPLPEEEDITMEDAHPFAGPQGRLDQPPGRPQQPQGHPQQPQGHPQQPQGHPQQPEGHPQQPEGHPQQHHPSGSGSLGTEGLASCMQHICHQHCVDLRRLLDESCQRALALLTAADAQHTLNQVVEDVKRNASAICMNRIRCLRPADRMDTCNGLGPALDGFGAASHSRWETDTSPVMSDHPKPDAMDTVVDTGAAEAKSAPGRSPLGPDAHGLGAIAARPALLSPARAAATGLSTWTPAGPPDWNATPGLAPPRPFIINAFQYGLPAIPNGAAPTAAAQRALWPAPEMPQIASTAQQAGPAANSPGAGPSRPDISRAVAAKSGPGTGAGAGLFPERREASPSLDYFGGQLLPANMTPIVKQRLHSVVAQHHQYLTPRDFDSAILGRLANMPEHKAMKVLNQAESANWAIVENKTRIIMSWCTKWAKF